MRETLRFGLVGAGAIAQTHAQSVERMEGATLVAVADPRAAAVESLCEGYRLTGFDCHEAMLEKTELDAVIVCSPPNTHHPICAEFLSQGIPVLCEKPLTLTSETARELVDLAHAQGVPFTMASKFRFVDDVTRARSLVTSGILGELILFENAFTARVAMHKRWNANPEVSGGGVLIDNGTHSVDIIQYFLGPIREVQAVEGRRVQSLKVEDTVQIFLRTESGVMGTVDLSWSLNKELESYVNIYGSQGTIRVGWQQSRYCQASSNDWISFGIGYDKLGCFVAQLDNFCAAIRGREPLRVSPEEALSSVAVIEAAYRSLQDNNWVPIAPGAQR